MLCLMLLGMELAVDFTAPALLALLSAYLPRAALLQMLSACVLHESAHFLLIALTGQKPAQLRVSAAGLRLTMQRGALCPMGAFCAILLAGAAANLLAAAGFALAGLPDAAAANLSLALFNLLPYRSTDGGTLLLAALEHRFCASAPELPQRIMRIICIFAAVLLSALLAAAKVRSLSLWGMLLFMTLAELTAD